MNGETNILPRNIETRKQSDYDRICDFDSLYRAHLNARKGKRLIYDNAACQKNKGTHFALDRFTSFLRAYYRKYGNDGYVLKCDVQKYFANIDHAVLKDALAKVVRDEEVRNLLFHYIDSYETPGMPGKGLPLGNQSSQTLAVFYLNQMDRLIKEELRVKYYVRYMDDWLLLHPDREYLKMCLQRIETTVSQDLKMNLNKKTQIYRLKDGIEFLGWRFYLTESGKVIRKIKRQSKVRFKRRIKKLNADYEAGLATEQEVRSCRASYEGHLKHGNTYQLRNRVLGDTKR